MAVHLLFRPAPAVPPPTPVSPVRRSARLGPHSATPPSQSGPSTSPTKPAASPSAKQRAAKGHISPIPNTRKRARPSEPQPQLHPQSDESDSEPPSAHAAAAATPLVPPLTPGPTPRSIRAQKRQKVSSTTDTGQLSSDQGPTASSLTPLKPTIVPKTRAAKRKSLVIDDDGEANALLQEPESLPTTRAPKRKRNENALQPVPPLVRSGANGKKTKLKATPSTTTTRGRASSQVQLTGDNNLPRVNSTKGKERARDDDILPGPIPNPKVVSLRSPRRSAGGLNSIDLVASSSIPSSVHGLNSKNDISLLLASSNTTVIPQSHNKDVPSTTRTTRAKARELLSLESNQSTMPNTTPALTPASSSPRLGPTIGIVLNTNVLSLALNQAPTIAGSKPGNSSQTTEPTSPSQTTKSTARPITQPHIHFHSPLTPLAHTTSTTPPGSPTLSARVSPPLDAVDLGLVLGGGGEGGGSSTSTNNSAAASPNTSVTVATPPPSPSASSGTKNTASADDFNTVAAPVSGGLFPSPILLPSIPTAAAAFLGAQEMPEQQRCIQPFNFPSTSPTEELGAPPPTPAAHVQTHPLPLSSTAAPEVMNIARDIIDVGFQEASVDIAGIPMTAPLNVSAIPASESELGFGFHPQEGFSSTTGIPSLGSSSSSSEQQHQQQTGQEQPEQRIYAQDTTAEQYHYPPGYDDRSQVQQEPQPTQQQNHHTTPLSLKQQRKLTYLDPLPLEHPPRIERDGSLWKTACKLRVFELLRHYPPDIIRSVVAQDAHTYYAARNTFPLGYDMSERERRRLLHKKLGLSLWNTQSRLHPRRHSTGGDSMPTSPKSPKARSEGEGESDGDDNEFMVERYYSFELADDDMEEGNLDWEGFEDVDMDLEEEDEDAEEDGWDDEDTDDETDEDEEVEIELKGLVGKKGAASAPSGNATGPAEKSTPLDDGILSGDEDAEGEMEVDIEAFSDPSFNAELSSPTSVSPTVPLSPVESMISSFYIPSVVPFPGAGFFSGGFPQQPQQPQHQQPQQEEGNEQTSPDEPFPQQVQQNDQQQKQHRHPPPPLQIQIAPANQGGFFASPAPLSPILPLPPPRLETIRVGYLRQSELGVKVTGKGTPADRSRAAQWAKGFMGGTRRSSRERENNFEEDEEGVKRGRPRLRMMAFAASEKCVGDAPPLALGSRTSSMGGLRLSLPSDVGVSPSPPPTPVVVDSVKCVETLDESDFGLKMGVHEVALPPSSSSTSSSVVTPIPAAAVEFVTADDEPHWHAFLASLDEKGGDDKAYQARRQDQQQQEASQPELELASTNNNSNPASPSSPPSSAGFTTPRPAAPPPTDMVFGLNTNIFDMGFVLDPNSWFGSGASASAGAGLGESPAASSVGDGQQGAIDVTSAAVGGTSTLSFALG